MINIQDLIDTSIQAWSTDKGQARDASKFSVSDAGLCYRSRYLKRLGVPATRVTPVGALRKMMAGEAAHEKLQNVLRATGALVSSEEELEWGDHILGHYDAIVSHEEQPVLLEFKTIEKWSMSHIKKDGPKHPHVLQMFTYWHLLRSVEQYEHLDQATLTYVQREDFSQVQFDYLWVEGLSKLVLDEWRPLVNYWRKKQLPDCTCASDYGGNGISYCRYQESADKCCNEELANVERQQPQATSRDH
jgi:hypothetical protein